jgi:uncharacterized protein YdaU (DUF1376 family)
MQIYSSNGTRLNYLYLNMDDLSQDTARMDDFEELVYIRLFFHYLNKLVLPADLDKLKRIVRLRHANDEQTKQAIEAFLALDGVVPNDEEPDTIRYEPWDAIIASTIEKFDKRSASGTNAANSRWKPRDKQPEVADDAAA